MRNSTSLLVLGAFGILVACSKTPEERGKELADSKIGLVKGIAEGLKERGKETGEAVGEGVAKTLKGVVTGVDVALALDTRLSPVLQESGLKATQSDKFKQLREGVGSDGKKFTTANGVSVYLVAEQSIDASLLLRAHNKQGQEVGRAMAPAKITAGNATYVDFAFDERVSLREVEYYSLDKAPPQ